MSDFRIPIKNSDGYIETELDWDEVKKKWSLSEKEGQRWEEGLTISSDQLLELFRFFRIESNQNISDEIISLSPGEITLLHSNSNKPISIYAALCPDCKKHWYIFKWDEGNKQWQLYGRNCDYTWEKGSVLKNDKIELLRNLRKVKDDPLSKP